MKKLIALLLMILPLGAIAQEVKIAYVKTQEVFMAMPEVSEMEKKMADLNEKYKGELQLMQDEYQKIYGSDKVIPQTVLLVLSQFENNYTSDYVRLKYDIQNSIRKVKSQPVDAANVLNENKIGVSPFYSAKIISKLFLCYSENTKSDFTLSLGM